MESEAIVHEKHEPTTINEFYQRCQSCAGRCNLISRHPSKQSGSSCLLQQLQREANAGRERLQQALRALESIQCKLRK